MVFKHSFPQMISSMCELQLSALNDHHTTTVIAALLTRLNTSPKIHLNRQPTEHMQNPDPPAPNTHTHTLEVLPTKLANTTAHAHLAAALPYTLPRLLPCAVLLIVYEHIEFLS